MRLVVTLIYNLNYFMCFKYRKKTTDVDIYGHVLQLFRAKYDVEGYGLYRYRYCSISCWCCCIEDMERKTNEKQ